MPSKPKPRTIPIDRWHDAFATYEEARQAQGQGNVAHMASALNRLGEILSTQDLEIGELPALTIKQKLFVDYYLESRNGVESAKRAGYKGNRNTLHVVASENLRKPTIAAEVQKRTAMSAMQADEVLRRLSQHARASLADLLTESGEFSLKEAKRKGVDHLLKKLKVRKDATGISYEYEIHDPQAALVHLGKHLGLFPNQIKLTVDDADKLINEAAKRHGLPLPETFGGEPVVQSEM